MFDRFTDSARKSLEKFNENNITIKKIICQQYQRLLWFNQFLRVQVYLFSEGIDVIINLTHHVHLLTLSKFLAVFLRELENSFLFV